MRDRRSPLSSNARTQDDKLANAAIATHPYVDTYQRAQLMKRVMVSSVAHLKSKFSLSTFNTHYQTASRRVELLSRFQHLVSLELTFILHSHIQPTSGSHDRHMLSVCLRGGRLLSGDDDDCHGGEAAEYFVVGNMASNTKLYL